jgi:hypothetical protein
MILIIWATFCTSCTSKPKTNNEVIAAPDPVDANGDLVIITLHKNDVFLTPEDGVYLPAWYWRKVVYYIVKTQAAQGIAYTPDVKK